MTYSIKCVFWHKQRHPGPLRKGTAMSEDKTSEGEEALQSYDPLEVPKKQLGRGLGLNLVLGGLSMLVLCLPEARETGSFLLKLNGWIIASGFVCPALLFIMAKVTRRAIYCVLVDSFGMGYLGWYLLLIGLWGLSEGAGDGGMSMGMSLLWFGVICVLVIGLLEWKFVPWIWQQSSKSGRMDLPHALFRPEIPPCNVAELPRPLRLQIPIVAVAAVGSAIGVNLRHFVGRDTSPVLIGVLGIVIAMGVAVIAWCWGFSIFFRMLRWEWANGRKLRIAPIERGEKQG